MQLIWSQVDIPFADKGNAVIGRLVEATPTFPLSEIADVLDDYHGQPRDDILLFANVKLPDGDNGDVTIWGGTVVARIQNKTMLKAAMASLKHAAATIGSSSAEGVPRGG